MTWRERMKWMRYCRRRRVKKTEPDACWEEEGDEKEREPIVGEL